MFDLHESIFGLKSNLMRILRDFYVTWITLLLIKHKLINFDWIVNDLIVHTLSINYQNLVKYHIYIWGTPGVFMEFFQQRNYLRTKINYTFLKVTRKEATGFKSLRLNCWDIKTQVIWKYKVSATVNKISKCFLIQSYSLT